MYDVIIAGAGLAGLSCAIELSKNPLLKVAIIEEKNIGGVLNLGGAKISLLPAGKLTADKIGHNFYLEKQIELTELFTNHMVCCTQKIETPETSLTLKRYDSYLINTNNDVLNSIFLNYLQRVNLQFTRIESISYLKDFFIVTLADGKRLECAKLVIATGRDEAIYRRLERLGQKYTPAMATVGCRCVFDSSKANKLHEYQLDFRAENSSGFRSYCYNYRGDLIPYVYGTHTIVSGIINTASNYGNVMIGQKKKFHIESLGKCAAIEIVARQELREYLEQRPIAHPDGMIQFVSQFEDLLGTTFIDCHFPALEQFWPAPLVNDHFASLDIPGLYFCGDATGVSFGFVQAYATGSFVALSLLE